MGRKQAIFLLCAAAVSCLAVLCRTASAVPAAPIVHELVQPDGTTLRAVKWGDEHRHGWETDDGYAIAIRVGSTMCCDDYGAFGLAFKTAKDLWGSFQRVERYGKVVTSIANYVVKPGNQSAFMAVKSDTNSRLGLQLTNELAIAAATALCREVSRQHFAPTEVHFSHEGPSCPSIH